MDVTISRVFRDLYATPLTPKAIEWFFQNPSWGKWSKDTVVVEAKFLLSFKMAMEKAGLVYKID